MLAEHTEGSLSPHTAGHLYHHNEHVSFITTHSMASLSPHWVWHLYHHNEHDSFITTQTHSMASLSPHTAWQFCTEKLHMLGHWQLQCSRQQ